MARQFSISFVSFVIIFARLARRIIDQIDERHLAFSYSEAGFAPRRARRPSPPSEPQSSPNIARHSRTAFVAYREAEVDKRAVNKDVQQQDLLVRRAAGDAEREAMGVALNEAAQIKAQRRAGLAVLDVLGLASPNIPSVDLDGAHLAATEIIRESCVL